MINLNLADNRTFFKTLADNSVDAIVTDAPYGISFMNKKWDHDVPSIDVWKECLRVLKPGGHMLVACGTRTQHRMVAPIEDAGFEIRDVITWLYGSGFPKSTNISIAIDKQAGVLGARGKAFRTAGAGDRIDIQNTTGHAFDKHIPITDAAKQWDGWGSALKPACEFWTLCRKPLSESTIAKNVLKWGTGGINVDGCRVEYQNELDKQSAIPGDAKGASSIFGSAADGSVPWVQPQGRFPANLILDEEAAAALDEQVSITMKMHGAGNKNHRNPGEGKKSASIFGVEGGAPTVTYDNIGEDSSKASRFFYCAKASKSDRGNGNLHPTVKPTKLMQYLCRLITPPGGTILDPFMGSGSTGVGALREGFKFIGVELCEEYFAIAQARLNGTE